MRTRIRVYAMTNYLVFAAVAFVVTVALTVVTAAAITRNPILDLLKQISAVSLLHVAITSSLLGLSIACKHPMISSTTYVVLRAAQALVFIRGLVGYGFAVACSGGVGGGAVWLSMHTMTSSFQEASHLRHLLSQR